MPLVIESIPLEEGEYYLPTEHDARAADAQAEALLRQAETYYLDGIKAENEAEGAGEKLLLTSTQLRITAEEIIRRRGEEEGLRREYEGRIKRIVFDSLPVTMPLRKKLQAVIEADPKDGQAHASVAFKLICPDGPKVLSGHEGEVSEELLDALKGRTLAEFYRNVTEERRLFLLRSAAPSSAPAN
jgi:hypothetical protein